MAVHTETIIREKVTRCRRAQVGEHTRRTMASTMKEKDIDGSIFQILLVRSSKVSISKVVQIVRTLLLRRPQVVILRKMTCPRRTSRRSESSTGGPHRLDILPQKHQDGVSGKNDLPRPEVAENRELPEPVKPVKHVVRKCSAHNVAAASD